MTRPERMLRRAEKEAMRVDYRWRLGCIAVAGVKVLSSGRNKFRHSPNIHPLQATWHAEEDCIRSLGPAKGKSP